MLDLLRVCAGGDNYVEVLDCVIMSGSNRCGRVGVVVGIGCGWVGVDSEQNEPECWAQVSRRSLDPFLQRFTLLRHTCEGHEPEIEPRKHA